MNTLNYVINLNKCSGWGWGWFVWSPFYELSFVKNSSRRLLDAVGTNVERGDDTVGNPHRAQIDQFELFELILLLDKRLPVERFEATVSQSTVPSPSLN